MSVTGQLAGGPPYFGGVLVDLVGVGESYVLLETAVGTGNRLLRFSSQSPDVAHALFEAELGSAGWHALPTRPSPRRSSPP